MAPSFPLASLDSLVARDEFPASQHTFQPYYIVGIVLAVSLVVGVLLWLVIRRFRKRAAWRKEREERVHALNIRGLVRNNGEKRRCVFLRVFVRACLTTDCGAATVMLSP